MIKTIKTFRELSTEELYEILRTREAVFIVEQNCPYPEADGKRQKCGRGGFSWPMPFGPVRACGPIPPTRLQLSLHPVGPTHSRRHGRLRRQKGIGHEKND